MVAVILAKPELGESSDVCAGGAVGEDMRNCIVWRGTELGSRMELGWVTNVSSSAWLGESSVAKSVSK